MTQEELIFWQIFGVVVSFVLLLCLIQLIAFIRDFSKELKRINLEIRRTHGREQQRWKSRRRKLWLSLIPFVRY